MTGMAQHREMETDPDGLQIALHLEWLTQRGRSPYTLRTYRQILHQAARQLPAGLCDAEPDEIAAWLATARARNTRAGWGVALRSFFRWGEHVGKVDLADNPMRQVDHTGHRRGVPRPVTDAELATILDGADGRTRLWCLLAAYAGLRRGEISRLDRGDITPETIRVAGKGDRERAVPTHPDIWAAVADLPPGPLAGCTPDHVGRRISHTARQLGLDGVTAHRLRHWYGTWTYRASGDVLVAQQLLGHASVANTMIYAQVADAARRAAVEALPRVSGATATDGRPDAGPR